MRRAKGMKFAERALRGLQSEGMGKGDFFKEKPGSWCRPLFLAIYVAVAVGIVFTGFFILSSFYSGVLSWSPSPHSIGSSAAPSATYKKPRINIWERDIWEAPPAGSKMPPLKSFRLSKELVKHRVKDNIIVVTFGNYGFMDFILNWVKHLTDLNVTNLLVGAMDVKLLEALYWKGVPVYDMGSQMIIADVGWGSAEFNKMGREKVLLINSFLPFGYELLVCDTDTVWLKNPFSYLARFPEADILSSTDSLVPTVTDDSLEDWELLVRGALNIGIFHWRPTNSTMKMAKKWKDLLLSDDKIWDQNGFNNLIYEVYGPSVEGNNGLVHAFDGKLKLGILPVSIFCSGHTYFVQALHEQLRLQPYSVHTSFELGGTPGKRHRLREALLFYDPPEYYNTPAGFLSFKPHIPKTLLMGGPHTLESHFSLVNYQIKQIRTALAIASILNRALVMPQLWCRFDSIWYGHPGVLPGTMTRQPFLCPLDHVFQIGYMISELPEDYFGPKIDFREYSFFDNPRVPNEVISSRLQVELCEEGSDTCSSPRVEVRRHNLRKLRLPKNSSEETIVQLLSPYSNTKVLEFSSMQNAFQGFSSQEKERKFRKRVQSYMGRWCCVENLTRGHIYYDMYWDEKPSWKPEPPKSKEEDHPPK
ncbi:arabinosyltransferase XEG113-like [Wolffia australiana]